MHHIVVALTASLSSDYVDDPDCREICGNFLKLSKWPWWAFWEETQRTRILRKAVTVPYIWSFLVLTGGLSLSWIETIASLPFSVGVQERCRTHTPWKRSQTVAEEHFPVWESHSKVTQRTPVSCASLAFEGLLASDVALEEHSHCV